MDEDYDDPNTSSAADALMGLAGARAPQSVMLRPTPRKLPPSRLNFGPNLPMNGVVTRARRLSRPSTSTTTSTSQSNQSSTPVHFSSKFSALPPFSYSALPPLLTLEASEGEPRRKRRKYEKIERRYECGLNGCTKVYSTLRHLNDHILLQGHGPKRRGFGE